MPGLRASEAEVQRAVAVVETMYAHGYHIGWGAVLPGAGGSLRMWVHQPAPELEWLLRREHPEARVRICIDPGHRHVVTRLAAPPRER